MVCVICWLLNLEIINLRSFFWFCVFVILKLLVFKDFYFMVWSNFLIIIFDSIFFSVLFIIDVKSIGNFREGLFGKELFFIFGRFDLYIILNVCWSSGLIMFFECILMIFFVLFIKFLKVCFKLLKVLFRINFFKMIRNWRKGMFFLF